MLDQKTSQPTLNPYSQTPKPLTTRIQADISTADYNLIKLIRPKSGTIHGVIGSLWSALCRSLRENQITDISKQNEFEQFLTSCRIVSDTEYRTLKAAASAVGSTPNGMGPDISSGRPLFETDRGNDGARVKRVRKVRADQPS